MEKPTPHCRLSIIRALIQAGRVRATMTAYQGARGLGIEDLDGMCRVILDLTPRDFHKSMTTHADHRLWQDVYRARLTSGRLVYLKLTVIDDLLVVSFEEL